MKSLYKNKKNTKSLDVIIADDHSIFRKGLKELLTRIKTVKSITEAENGEIVLELLKEQKCDIVFMDISMPVMNGDEATREIAENYPDVKVIALTVHDNPDMVCNMFNYGAMGYLLKDTGLDEIRNAIEKVLRNDFYFSSKLSPGLIYRLLKMKEQSNIKHEKNVLSETDKKILSLICEEYTNDEIAEKLHLSHKTTMNHRTRMLDILKVRNSAGLVKYAIKNGIYKL